MKFIKSIISMVSMITNEYIIGDVIENFHVDLTFYELVKYVSTNYQKYQVGDCSEYCTDGKLNIDSEINVYSNKVLSKIPTEKLKKLYTILFKAWISKDNKIKMSNKMCYILKELVKPSELVSENSHSLFKKNLQDQYYYIPRPHTNNYGDLCDYETMESIESKTKDMKKMRFKFLQQREEKEERKNLQRKLLN